MLYTFSDILIGGQKSCNFFDGLQLPQIGQGMILVQNDVNSPKDCKAICDQHLCLSYYFLRNDKVCKVMTTSFAEHSRKIYKLGGSKYCTAKFETCVNKLSTKDEIIAV